MTAELRRGLFLAVLGLILGLGLVAGLFGGGAYLKRMAAGPEHRSDAAPGPVGALSSEAGKIDAAPGAKPDPAPQAAAPQAPAEPSAPTFDIVRVEPNGESVVAGRGAPNTVVELLVDGKAVAKALADPNGQFAIVPPALPSGNSEIVLRATNAEGRETRSKDSVAVAVSKSRDAKPLVALTSPDKPTVVLSQPDAPAAAAQKATPNAPAGRQAAPGKDPAKDSAGKAVPAKPAPSREQASADAKSADAKSAPVKIVSVDAQEGGRLFVTGHAAPGATVRLYLNDTLIAPGSVGGDGTVTFTIGRGVKPGAYTVRVDQVDSVSGKVRGRAEVPFTVPEPARVAAAERPAAKPAEKPAAAPPDPEVKSVAPAASPTPAALEPAKPAPGGVFVPEIATARIIRGDSLWEISRRTYGSGDRYTVIYDANQEQIRNPDLIYPGQIFVLPGEKDGKEAGKRG